MNKDLKKLLAKYNITNTETAGSSHYKVRVNGALIICSATPSHQRVLKEIEGDIKRALRNGFIR